MRLYNNLIRSRKGSVSSLECTTTYLLDPRRVEVFLMDSNPFRVRLE